MTALADNTMQRTELGVAIIGAGRIGALRAQLAAGHPAVRFLALADIDAARNSRPQTIMRPLRIRRSIR